MDTTLLTPSTASRPGSPRNEWLSNPQGPDDGYDYNKIDIDPAIRATKPRDLSSPVAASEALQEIIVSATHEDQENAYTEALPHIYQRQQGGWNAKVPDLETSRSNGLVPYEDTGKYPSRIKRLMLRWTLDRHLGRRTLLVNDVKEDGHLEDPDLQRRVFWKHCEHEFLDINRFETAIKECENQLLSKGEVDLARRLLIRLRTIAERPFVGGRYLTPLALRYDNQDVSRYTVDKTCIFFSFPYLSMATPGLRKHFPKGHHEHPPRTLLQSHYRLNNTTDRDRFQCINLLKDHEVRAYVKTLDGEDENTSPAKKTQQLLYVPQFWGIIIGLDTLITSGPLNDRSLLGSAIKAEDRRPPPTVCQLSLVRILFYCQARLEDLIYPVSQCNSWFGLVNKEQQILEFLDDAEGTAKPNGDSKRSVAEQNTQKPNEKETLTSKEKAKASQAEKPKSTDTAKPSPVDGKKKSPTSKAILTSVGKTQQKPTLYKFWHEDDRPVPVNITIYNWASVLRDGRHKEVLNIWMRKDVPSITVQSSVDHKATEQQNTGQSEEAWTRLPSVTRPFLTWPILDEFGELDPLDLDGRCERFLRAFVLDLPVPVTMSRQERARRPKQASAQRVGAKTSIPIAGKTLAEVRDEIKADGNNAFAIEICDKFSTLLGFFLPASYGINLVSDPIRLYWGAVSELTAATKNVSETLGFHKLSSALDILIADATRLHQGVHCSDRKQVPSPGVWREENNIAEGAVLLSATVEALGAIFRILIESVRFIRSDHEPERVSLMEPSSAVSQYAKEASDFLRVARDQLIRKADGKDKNDTIGPVLTPEAITITLMRRLVSGVSDSGSIEVINLYEECLEHLTLDVKYEASRRLLQKINEFKEEIAIISNVLEQQDRVLTKFRSSLDPKEFRTPSVTRRLRFEYECKDIDEILQLIKSQQRSCAELADRANILAVQNVELVETLQDDNSKAIFIFTLVTVLFLPLSFVAGFFGMNVVGISGTTSTVSHFWAIALPLTFGLVILCGVVGVKGEDTYFAFARIWRHTKRGLLIGQ